MTSWPASRPRGCSRQLSGMAEIATAVAGRRAYGLAVSGADESVELASLSSAAADLHRLVPVRVVLSAAPPATMPVVEEDRIIQPLGTEASVDLDRRRGTATFFGEPLRPELITHPYLATAAIGFNRWAGREVLHAGAFVAAGHAWVVLGASTAGKSTLMAALATAGVPVLADDVVVTDGEVVFAGPRCVDLRQELPADVLPWSTLPVRRARGDLRWRIDLPPIAHEVPLGGWFFLDWDDEPAMEPMTMSALLGRLATWRLLRGLPSDPATILALAARPGWHLRRPREWSGLPHTLDQMLGVAGEALDRRRDLAAVQR
jgi:hypothetical protein